MSEPERPVFAWSAVGSDSEDCVETDSLNGLRARILSIQQDCLRCIRISLVSGWVAGADVHDRYFSK